ncbi:hypothetical protein C9413_21665 [Rhizobium sp. SEMIA 4085]|uniref:hypothetical protein n=1 Tax=Rhizobium sp. SEMIA 4085 TaxID=2137761 RepID=UPI001478A277|nr:hypothetical protein [Rhizobium sp. SEMIA 4085]NNH31984.1 hypothetical protein [Rhizobium sp. SEMIA 4085]
MRERFAPVDRAALKTPEDAPVVTSIGRFVPRCLSNQELLGKAILEACAPHKPVVSSRSEGPSWANGLIGDAGDVDSFAKASSG